MGKPDDIPQDVWDGAQRTVENNDIMGTGPCLIERVSRALLKARQDALEEAAAFIEGKGGKISGASMFAPLICRNNMPDMSGDPRSRLTVTQKRDFDIVTQNLASAVRDLPSPPE